MLKKSLFVLFFAFTLALTPQAVLANQQPFPATIINISEINSTQSGTKIQWLELKNQQTSDNLFIKNEQSEYFKYTPYQVGEQLLIAPNQETNEYQITDYYRQNAISFLFWIFVVVVIAIGKLYGLTSLVGMAFSLAVIIKIILPQIGSGTNPILVVIVAAIFLIPSTFYLSHGINTKTNLAIVGTFISALITATLAVVFTHLTKLTGFASEEASFLDMAKQGTINIQSLLISGIIIGSIGILDDVSVSQVSVVQQLSEANPKFTFVELFKRSMSVGRGHVASMVNTLFLVYTGAAMPLMLLFLDNSLSFMQIINTEIIAEEVVRTLVASIGLILAVPITTFMASKYYNKNKTTSHSQQSSHNHRH